MRGRERSRKLVENVNHQRYLEPTGREVTKSRKSLEGFYNLKSKGKFKLP